MASRIFKNTKFSLLIIVNVICVAIVFFYSDNITAKKVIKIIHSDIHYDSRSSDPAISSFKEFRYDRKSEAKSIFISFEMKALDDNYDNLFQTANDPQTLRFELTHPNTASLIIGNVKSGIIIYKITDDLALNVWHKINIYIDENKKIEVDIDGQNKLSVVDKSIKYSISDIAIGTGYNKLRGFQGEIKKFTLEYEHYKHKFVINIIMTFTNILSIVTFFLLLYHLLIIDQPSLTNKTDAAELLAIIGIALFHCISRIFRSRILPLHINWIPFLSLGLVAPILALLYSRLLKSSYSQSIQGSIGKILLSLVFLITVLFLLYNSIEKPFQSSPRLLILIIGSTTLLN